MAKLNYIKSLEKIGFAVSNWLNSVGIFALAAMMLVTVVDVFGRYCLNMPLKGAVETTGVLLLFTILFGIPYATARHDHITIDTLTKKFSSRTRDYLNIAVAFICFLLCAVIVWKSFEYALRLNRMNQATQIIKIPLSPLALIISFIFVILCLLYFIFLIKNFKLKSNSIIQIANRLLSLILLFTLFVVLAFFSKSLPFHINPLSAGIIALVFLFIVFLAGLPVFASFLLIGLIGMCYIRGPNAGFILMGSVPFTSLSNYTFSVIPLFVLMGEFCFFSGLGKDLYEMAYKWVGSLPGGLSMGTVVACGGFAAVCGDSMATAVTMGTIAIPEMSRYKYDPKLAVGCVAAGGTLGVLIPPSLAFILYALLTDQSIASLFIAGILPGILLIFLFIGSIYFRAYRNPALGPPGPKTSFSEKIKSLKGVWATILLFVIVIGGMYAGVFTPTEGGGIGAFGALLVGLFRRRLNRKSIIDSLMATGKISAVCIIILIGAQIFGYFLAVSKLPMTLATTVAELPVPSPVILIAILMVYLFLGCLMPAIPMLILTVPIFFPVVLSMGYDPIWFGVIMVLMFEIAVITPPMGINVLAMRAVIKEIDLAQMFQGVIPFFLTMILCVAILIIFPNISLFLPNLLNQ